jgi:uncharacterized protein (TIGR02246 family)
MSHAPTPRRRAWPVLTLIPGFALTPASVLVPALGLALALGLSLTLAGCDGSPTAAAAQHDGALAPTEAVAAQMATVTPAMERGIQQLLQNWEASWAAGDGIAYGANFAEDADFINPLGGILSGRQAIAATHVFLFNGPFAGSVQTGQVRRIVALTGTLAIVDLDGLLTGVVAFPPGLEPTGPGEIATRGRMVVARNGARWEILAQQLTRIAPPPF